MTQPVELGDARLIDGDLFVRLDAVIPQAFMNTPKRLENVDTLKVLIDADTELSTAEALAIMLASFLDAIAAGDGPHAKLYLEAVSILASEIAANVDPEVTEL